MCLLEICPILENEQRINLYVNNRVEDLGHVNSPDNLHRTSDYDSRWYTLSDLLTVRICTMVSGVLGVCVI